MFSSDVWHLLSPKNGFKYQVCRLFYSLQFVSSINKTNCKLCPHTRCSRDCCYSRLGCLSPSWPTWAHENMYIISCWPLQQAHMGKTEFRPGIRRQWLSLFSKHLVQSLKATINCISPFCVFELIAHCRRAPLSFRNYFEQIREPLCCCTAWHVSLLLKKKGVWLWSNASALYRQQTSFGRRRSVRFAICDCLIMWG